MLEVLDVEQGSAEWHAARCGVVTASRLKDVLAEGDGKMRGKYLRELASERLRGWVEDGYNNAHMERGHEQEDEARRAFAFEHVVKPVRVGFIRNGRVGCSPDSLLGEDGGLEIKTALGHIQIERLKSGKLPSEHKAQVYGSMWITGRQWWSFVSYSPDLPLMHVRVERDEEYIARIAAAVEAFNAELDALVSSLGGVDQFRRAAA
jgi:hypothetical protein